MTAGGGGDDTHSPEAREKLRKIFSQSLAGQISQRVKQTIKEEGEKRFPDLRCFVVGRKRRQKVCNCTDGGGGPF